MSKLSRFAGLMGFGAKAAEDDKPEDQMAEKPVQEEGESDEDFQKRLDKWKEEGGEEEAAAPADPGDESEKCKKAKEEGVAEGVAAERARWSGVLASTEAAGTAITACSLLADTDMAAASIQKTLAALPAESTRSTLAQRTQNQPTPAPAIDGGKAPEAGSPAAFAAAVQASRELVRPSKKTA